MLGLLQRLPLRIQRFLSVRVGLFRGLHLRCRRVHDLLMANQTSLGRRLADPLGRLLTRDFIQLQLNLPAALLKSLQPLRKPQAFHLLLMQPLLKRRRFLTQCCQALVMAA